MSAREEILSRLRTATADITTQPGARGEVPVIGVASPGAEHTLELFAENVADYRASVTRCRPDEVGQAVAAALVRARAHVLLVPDGVDASWVEPLRDSGIRVVRDEGLTPDQLDEIDAVVTASRVGIATTGTIVLDHADDQGRRALTLVPDQHVCVIRADQVVHDVPDAVAMLDPARALTWISGPSATSDIELDRVEGVHGPRTLDVVIVS
ncbi:LutC/YkgG family protein [Ornithinimicrobium cerasi]|uniref:L-lactate dehydrogenase complex protein LldG n=1 Tax=Ornithinimicrobium cerasi TaxID=2248773 RepID=A0A285VHE0_9MICO|nr:LUD domain-containing protein [Ornithinimicrobium cerasi]SOC52596.1 L-lactate dehydrogenase complex protein LldG [Ornithinimicrobium cerasi]